MLHLKPVCACFECSTWGIRVLCSWFIHIHIVHISTAMSLFEVGFMMVLLRVVRGRARQGDFIVECQYYMYKFRDLAVMCVMFCGDLSWCILSCRPVSREFFLYWRSSHSVIINIHLDLSPCWQEPILGRFVKALSSLGQGEHYSFSPKNSPSMDPCRVTSSAIISHLHERVRFSLIYM